MFYAGEYNDQLSIAGGAIYGRDRALKETTWPGFTFEMWPELRQWQWDLECRLNRTLDRRKEEEDE